jgi:hypothetical protein
MAPRRNRPRGNQTSRDPALYELQRQALEKAECACDMLTQINGHTEQTALTLQSLHTVLDQMVTGGGGGGGGGMPFFPGAGPSYGFGPNGGRPIMPPNQTQRPPMGFPGNYPPGGYPGGQGGPGGGFSGSPFPNQGWNNGFVYGGFGGALGLAQVAAARAMHRSFGAGQGGAVSYRPNPDGTYNSYDAQGNLVESNIAQDVAQRRAQVSSAAGRFGASGSLIGAIQHIPLAGRIAGAVLIPAEGLQRFGNFIGNQRAANAQYESIYGPGTSGWDQRMSLFGGRFRNTLGNIGSLFGGAGGMSDQDFEQAFKGISAMGFQGGDRNNMITFATKNFNDLGMSVSDSLQLIATNAKEASTSFSTLHDQLVAVSQMAQETGQSAEVLRQSFSRAYTNAVNTGFAGASGPIAQAQVAATAGQGRMFAGVDTSTMYSSIGAQQILASRMGYSDVLDFQLATASNPQVLATAQDKVLDQMFASVVPANVRVLVERSIARNGGSARVANDQNVARTVVREVEQQTPRALGGRVVSILNAMTTAGMTVPPEVANDPTAIAVYYVQWVAKQGRIFGAPTAAAIAQINQQVVGGTPGRTTFVPGPHGEVTSTQTVGGQSNRDLARQFQAAGSDVGARDDFARNAGLPYSGDAYQVNKRGQLVVDPVIGKLEKDHVTYVRVRTSKGDQVVDLTDASRHYRDQLVNGSAIIMNGPHAGNTVGDVVGREQNARYPSSIHNAPTKWEQQHPVIDPKTMKQIQGLGLDGGNLDKLVSEARGLGSDKKIVEEARRLARQQATQQKVTGTITVGMKPEVARYLDIATSGDSLVNTAAAAGGPPTIGSTGSSTGH